MKRRRGRLPAPDVDVGRVVGDVAGVVTVGEADEAGLAPAGAPAVANLRNAGRKQAPQATNATP